jgi:hypothetical protein
MITFVNKEIENLESEPGKKFQYAEFALLALNSPVQQGMTVDDINKRIKLMETFRNVEVNAEIKMTEEGHKLLSTCVKNMRWRIIHESIPTFAEYVEGLKDSELVPEEGK